MKLKPGEHLITLVIDKIIQESVGFRRFVFAPGQGIHFEAGQYLTLIHDRNGSEIRRSYSITASPVLEEPLEIGVKRVVNGYYSRLLYDHARPGDGLITTGAAGLFRLPADVDSRPQVVLFAAGSGIAPVFSLVKTILAGYNTVRARLIYSSRSRETAAFHDALNELTTRYPSRLHIDWLYSVSSHAASARLSNESLTRLLHADKAALKDNLYFVCGPEAYMRMIVFVLRERGVPGDNIRREDFSPASVVSLKSSPPDKSARRVTIQTPEGDVPFTVEYPSTILQGARNAGLFLPHSCDNGRCGNCAIMRVSGQVWMTNNEVLTDTDVAKGLTLTCVGHPVYGDVVLSML